MYGSIDLSPIPCLFLVSLFATGLRLFSGIYTIEDFIGLFLSGLDWMATG
jgi:hypothetical protein